MVALSLALAACGGPKETTPTPAPAASEPVAETPAAEPDVTPEAAPVEETTPEAAPAEEAAAEPTVTETPAVVEAAAEETANPFEGLPEPYNTADYALGKRTFKLCQSCHTANEGGGNLVGPNLHGVFGRAAGSKEGFAYSDAMKNSGIVWSPAELETYLENPAKDIPGNRMSFAGVRKPADRAAVIAYLMVESGYTPE
ncbi:MAG: cytochrome c family protein [Hyphomonas sp.]